LFGPLTYEPNTILGSLQIESLHIVLIYMLFNSLLDIIYYLGKKKIEIWNTMITGVVL